MHVDAIAIKRSNGHCYMMNLDPADQSKNELLGNRNIWFQKLGEPSVLYLGTNRIAMSSGRVSHIDRVPLSPETSDK